MLETIIVEYGNAVVRLTLNRPDRLNSFTAQMHAEVRGALKEIESSAARVLVITGAGRAFCSGQDLKERVTPAGQSLDLGESIEKNYEPLVRALRALPIPVVAAVNGVTAGAGANLALACDIAIAKKSAKFLEPFCRLGLIPDTGGTYFLPRLLGTARAMGVTLLAKELSAEQAAQWGLIWECVEDAKFAEAVESLAAQLAAAPPLAIAQAKRAIYASDTNTLDQQLNIERDALRELGCTSDYREGISAFMEKRSPKFTGK
jgi:2-(1,2-epoxy-1,2-dihydrophenyl)acetyl-CoA isomerase